MFKGHCFPKEDILQAVYFKLRFSLSYRDVEELLSIRGVEVDHATIQRWVYKFTPLIEAGLKKRRKKVVNSWRMDETYIKVKGDKEGPNTSSLEEYEMPYSAEEMTTYNMNENRIVKVIPDSQSLNNSRMPFPEFIEKYEKSMVLYDDIPENRFVARDSITAEASQRGTSACWNYNTRYNNEITVKEDSPILQQLKPRDQCTTLLTYEQLLQAKQGKK